MHGKQMLEEIYKRNDCLRRLQSPQAGQSCSEEVPQNSAVLQSEYQSLLTRAFCLTHQSRILGTFESNHLSLHHKARSAKGQNAEIPPLVTTSSHYFLFSAAHTSHSSDLIHYISWLQFHFNSFIFHPNLTSQCIQLLDIKMWLLSAKFTSIQLNYKIQIKKSYDISSRFTIFLLATLITILGCTYPASHSCPSVTQNVGCIDAGKCSAY